MKVAIATGDGVRVTDHFGLANQFQIWNLSGPSPSLLATRRNRPACGADGRGETRDPMDASVDLVADCRAVVVAQIGECALNRLAALGILAFETDDLVATTLRDLTEFDFAAAQVVA